MGSLLQGAKFDFYPVPANLAGLVSGIYAMEVEVPDGVRATELLPPENANIRVVHVRGDGAEFGGKPVEQGISLVSNGPTSRAVSITLSTAKVWGVGLTALGFVAMMREDASKWADRVAVADDSHPVMDSEDLLASVKPLILEGECPLATIAAHFAERFRPCSDRAKIEAIAEQLAVPGVDRAQRMAENLGMHTRTLERHCKRYFGFPPKYLIKRMRLMRTLTRFSQNGTTWSEALDPQYSDHAHFTREFRTLMGVCPTQFAAVDRTLSQRSYASRIKIYDAPIALLDRI